MFTCPMCGHSVAPPPPELLRLGRVTVDTGTYEVFVDSAPRHVTPLLTSILIIMMRRPGHLFSRDALMDAANMWDTFPHTFDVHICRLRQAIGDALDIHTVRGRGWALREPVPAPA